MAEAGAAGGGEYIVVQISTRNLEQLFIRQVEIFSLGGFSTETLSTSYKNIFMSRDLINLKPRFGTAHFKTSLGIENLLFQLFMF